MKGKFWDRGVIGNLTLSAERRRLRMGEKRTLQKGRGTQEVFGQEYGEFLVNAPIKIWTDEYLERQNAIPCFVRSSSAKGKKRGTGVIEKPNDIEWMNDPL